MDRQSAVYRQLPINEHAQDIELGAWSEAEHPPATSLDGLVLPEDYEEAEWDRGRERPKTLEEARGALLERILNRRAPDGDESAGAYSSGRH